jgi:hypothetical protein
MFASNSGYAAQCIPSKDGYEANEKTQSQTDQIDNTGDMQAYRPLQHITTCIVLIRVAHDPSLVANSAVFCPKARTPTAWNSGVAPGILGTAASITRH